DDEEDVGLAFRRENRDDIRMVERGQQARLPQQLAEVERLLVRNLERDFLVDPGVLREVDRAEAAAADRREDFVLADDLPEEKHPRGSITRTDTVAGRRLSGVGIPDGLRVTAGPLFEQRDGVLRLLVVAEAENQKAIFRAR